ncbi:unnamed protein product, partial [Iphiclides podalirius]
MTKIRRSDADEEPKSGHMSARAKRLSTNIVSSHADRRRRRDSVDVPSGEGGRWGDSGAGGRRGGGAKVEGHDLGPAAPEILLGVE